MTLCDVNILVYAHRSEMPEHSEAQSYLSRTMAQGSFAYSSLILSGFLRIVTHPKVFKTPTPVETALEFAETMAQADGAIELQPTMNHWQTFLDLVRNTGARGNFIPDCYLAALAIEHGTTFVTTDRNFSRFQDLKLQFL